MSISGIGSSPNFIPTDAAPSTNSKTESTESRHAPLEEATAETLRLTEVEIRPPEGYDSVNEYIRSWTAQNADKMKLLEPEGCVIDRTGFYWLSGSSAVGIDKYSGAFDYFMQEAVGHLSIEDYAKARREFESSCLKAEQEPGVACITLRGVSMTIQDFNSMYEAMSQAYNQAQNVFLAGSKEASYMNSNWLLYARDAVEILSVKHTMQKDGISDAVINMVTEAMDARSDLKQELADGKQKPPGWEKLYEKLLQVDVSSAADSHKEFGNIIDWLKEDVKKAYSSDYYLSRRIDEIAGNYAKGLAEMIQRFNLA